MRESSAATALAMVEVTAFRNFRSCMVSDAEMRCAGIANQKRNTLRIQRLPPNISAHPSDVRNSAR